MKVNNTEDIRTLRQLAQLKKQKRGSLAVWVIIALLLGLSAFFYLKTTFPNLFAKASTYADLAVKGEKSLETVADTLYNNTQPENKSGESGDIAQDTKNMSSFYKEDITAMPVLGATLTSDYGGRTDPVTGKKNATHGGIDLAAPKGSNICSYKNGIVSNIGFNDIYGNFIYIDHGNNVTSFYAHLDSITVAEGESVNAGEKIGIIGCTGKSTGTHLHFELSVDGKRVDPAKYLYETA